MYLLYDVGATNMRLAVSSDHVTLGPTRIVSTPKDFETGMAVFRATALALLSGARATAVAGGIVGPFNKAKTMLVNTPNLPGWNHKPFQATLEKMFGAPAYMENDTDVVGLGEAVYGAGKGYRVVVYITVSTGVGGGYIVDGKIQGGVWGTEPGHQIIDPARTLAPSGCLEDYVSGTAVEKRFGRKPYQVHDASVWEELARWLAYGLHNTIVHWSPEIVVLGGSMMTKDPAIPLESVRKYLAKILKIFPEVPPLELAQLGDVGGLYGALQHIKSLHA